MSYLDDAGRQLVSEAVTAALGAGLAWVTPTLFDAVVGLTAGALALMLVKILARFWPGKAALPPIWMCKMANCASTVPALPILNSRPMSPVRPTALGRSWTSKPDCATLAF